MNSITGIHHLYAYEDGDTLTPRMGVSIESGYGLTQYWDIANGCVIDTDFTKHPATLYPQAYSSRQGKVIVPSSTGIQWYYNNTESSASEILDSSGNVKSDFASLFKVGTIESNGQTFPALTIIGNLATADDLTDKYIYFSGQYNGRTFMCQQVITVQATVSNAYTLFISAEGADGTGDDILSDDNDYVKLTPYLQMSGTPVDTDSSMFTWYRFVDGEWSKITSTTNVYEISGGALTIYEAGVDGAEMFKCVCNYNGTEYSATYEITDVHDPYFIDPNGSIAGETIKSGETQVYSPVVYKRSDISSPDTDHDWSFTFTVLANDGSEVAATTTAKTCTLTYDQVLAAGGTSTIIEASC
ncbi:MAG: hypothetical protein LUC88_00290 [Prevotella sp.]|nr:hypothetical protein [Prevotella sp.]